MSLLVVGSIALDTLKMPNGKVHKDVLGGSCAYFIHSAHFFTPVRVVGAVGDDFPKKHLDGFKKCRADLTGLQTLPGKTFQWHGTYHKDMNNRDTDALHFGVLETFQPVLPPKFRNSDFVFLACSQPHLQLMVLDQIEGKPCAVCDTIEVYIQNDRPMLDKLIKRCSGMIINDSEARLMTGEDNIVKAAAGIHKKYKLEFLIVKKGEHGGVLVDAAGITPFPAYPLMKVVDPTGAGDTFAAGVMATLARKGKADPKTLRQAIANGTACASYACEGLGLSKLMKLTARDVNARAREFVKMTSLG